MRGILFFLYVIIYQTAHSQSIDSTMVLIPAGEFMMGKDAENGADYSPAHKVKLNAFYIDVHEVTNAEYLEFCRQTNHNLPEFWGIDKYKSGEEYPDCPVIGVSFFDALSYAKWAGKRLPTEAEWECAARGKLIGNTFPAGEEYHNYPEELTGGSSVRQLYPVMKRVPNGYGLYDMAGSVREWVLDNYGPEYYKNGPNENPLNSDNGKFKIIRGGGWKSGKMCMPVYLRDALMPSWVDICVGFRCVKDVE